MQDSCDIYIVNCRITSSGTVFDGQLSKSGSGDFNDGGGNTWK